MGLKEKWARYNRTIKGRYRDLKSSAKSRNLTLTITLNQYQDLVQGCCKYCHGPLPEVGYALDRKDSSVGYELENVVPCCGDCNTIKSDVLTYNEMLFVMGQLRRLRAGKPNRT